MKTTSIIVLCFFFQNVFSQILINENSSFYIGHSSFMTENSKLENGYFYNIILNDSAKVSDTVYKNASGKTRTLMIYNGFNSKTNWNLSITGFFSEKPFKIGSKIVQIIYFKDSLFSVGGKSISNSQLYNTYCILSIDTNGNNLELMKIGHESDSSELNKLIINAVSYNNSGNLVFSGYRNGSTVIGGQAFYDDTTVSTYFIAEISNSGALLNQNILFKTESIYFVSRGTEFENNLIFQSGFDSISVNNKNYTTPFILGQRINDVALFSVNKNNLSLNNYVIMKDSTGNILLPGNGIICNSNGILWPVESINKYIKLNDTFITNTNQVEQVYFLLDKNTLKYKNHFIISTEQPASIEVDVFNQSNFIVTTRNPGFFVKVNNDSIPMPNGSGLNAFITIDASNNSKLIFSVSGIASAVKLSKYSPTELDIWVSYFASNSNLVAKTQTLNRNLAHLSWRFQITNYTFKNFSSVNYLYQYPVFNIYPNPTKGIINLDLDRKYIVELNLLQIKVYSNTGQLIEVFNAQNEIDLTNLVNGIYYIETIYNSYPINTQRLILLKD